MPISTLMLHVCFICLIILGISANSVTLVIERNVLGIYQQALRDAFAKTPGAQIGV